MPNKQKNLKRTITTTSGLKVLVTGASGFLGRRLVPALLSKGFSVTCLVRSDPGPGLWADCTMVLGDIRDQECVSRAVSGVDAVIHLAAVVNAKNPDEYQTVNVEGTRILVQEAVKAKAKHIIFISSVDVGHQTLYGRSKEEGEAIVKTSGIPFTIFRPGPIYGPGDNKNLMELFDLIKNHKIVPVIGDGNYLRQPIHVDDAVHSIIAVLESGKAFGKTYYLGGPSITYNEILAAMMEASDNRPTVVHLPSGLAKIFVMAINKFGLGPNISQDQIKTIDQDKMGDVSPIKNDFGIRARPFKQGFTQALEELHAPKMADAPHERSPKRARKQQNKRESKGHREKLRKTPRETMAHRGSPP